MLKAMLGIGFPYSFYYLLGGIPNRREQVAREHLEPKIVGGKNTSESEVHLLASVRTVSNSIVTSFQKRMENVPPRRNDENPGQPELNVAKMAH